MSNALKEIERMTYILERYMETKKAQEEIGEKAAEKVQKEIEQIRKTHGNSPEADRMVEKAKEQFTEAEAEINVLGDDGKLDKGIERALSELKDLLEKYKGKYSDTKQYKKAKETFEIMS